MGGVDEAARLVHSIYDVVLGRDDWPSIIGGIAAATNGHSGLLRLVDCRRASEGFVAAFGYEAAHLQSYREHFIQIDPYRQYLATAPAGALLTSDDYVPLRERRHTEYHNDYERPHDRIHALGSPLGREDEFLLYLGLSRGRHAGPYDVATLDFLRALAPHLLRAVQIQRLLHTAISERQLCEAALNELRLGVVLLDLAAAVCFANAAALEIAAAFGIGVSHKGIVIPSRLHNDRFQHLVAQAVITRTVAHDQLTYAAPGIGILQLRVMPFLTGAEPSLGERRPRAAIFMVRPGELRLSAGQLAIQFGLTAAESRLAARLAQGEALADAATASSISLATARSHLRGIFRKTATRRQSDLIQLLLTSLAGLTRDGPLDRGIK